jgi:sugar phosphate isomerase/epimerase
VTNLKSDPEIKYAPMKKKILFYNICVVLLTCLPPALKAQSNAAIDPASWRLGSQAYTFNRFSLEETLHKLKSCGIRYVELFPGQKIYRNGNATTSYTMSAGERDTIKQLLTAAGIKAVCYGVVTGHNKEEWRKIFEFAKDMGLEYISTEPAFDQLDLIEQLCKEFNIRAALHNHPVPSVYWHPRVLTDRLKGRSNLIGACADIGHWVRSGLNPVDCLRELEGRLIGFHLKDLNAYGTKTAHDVPWGTGNCNIAGVLNELKRQGWKGYFSIEYEYNWDNNLPEVRECIAYFNRVVAQLQ